MNSINPQLVPKEVSDLAEKDLDLVFALVVLGEKHNSADYRVWGELIKAKYNRQTARRLYVKTFISLVESVLFTLKSEALKTDSSKLSQAELALLKDKTYELSNKGEATERIYLGNIEKNLKFAFRCFAKAIDINYNPDYSGVGWQSFQKTVRIRNRITHPKFAIDMSIDDNEQETINKAHNWFVENYRALLGGAIEKLNSHLGKLGDHA